MGKLSERVKNAGFNAGVNYYARTMELAELGEEPEIAALFKIHENTLKEVTASIKQNGYDSAEPVVIWKSRNVIVDGHTRVKAAKLAGLTEIPVIEKEFEDVYAAILYTFERQANRRNLTQAEIYAASVTLHDKAVKARDGGGRSAELLAEKLNVAAFTIYRARKIHLAAPEEDLRALQNNETTINHVYKKVKEGKRPKAAPAAEGEKSAAPFGDGGGREKTRFLKSAVILLAGAGFVSAVKPLVNHFLGKNERSLFYKSLPEDARHKLEGESNDV
jgi:ParB family chromosome partitioning protein